MELKIEINKNDEGVKIDWTDDADIHEVVGLLAVTMNHLTLQAQGIDMEKVIDNVLER